MALITLQQMYDAWKRVADWVSGANTDKPPVRVTDGTDTLTINPDGSLPVQLTGRIVEELLPRGIIKSNFASSLMQFPPYPGVKGVMFTLRIYGVTGNFNTGEGIRLRLVGTSGNSNTSITQTRTFELSSNRFTNSGNICFVLYPNLRLDTSEFPYGTTLERKSVPYVPFGGYRINADVTGTFLQNEGFDCDIVANYLF